MAALPASLPELNSARLPDIYQDALNVLAECARVDECQQWADKAAALASYARQADDETLHRYADRIKARAIRRGGELLRQIEPGQGARDGKRQEGARPPLNRTIAATEAGLSEHQRKTMLRVANVPAEDFERQVESDAPPTVTALAEQGKQAWLGKATPVEFQQATAALAALRRLAELATNTDPLTAARGVQAPELAVARTYVETIDAWLDRFVIALGDPQR